MKVKELIAALSMVDRDLVVYLSKDAEGNQYKPLNQWSDEFYVDLEDDEDVFPAREVEPNADQLPMDRLVKALVLWPS